MDLSIGNGVTMRADGTPSASLGRIDQYELVKELGGGGFGTVFLARDTVAGIEVAVKGLPPLVRVNKEELENIRRNFVLVSRLHHPHIAAALVLHPVKTATYAERTVAEKLRVFDGDTLMVMEYAPGVTLSQWRKQFPGGTVPCEQTLEIVRQIADALDYAHAEKIIHRDIKPSNVMIETRRAAENAGDGGERSEIVARVLDFGLAAEVRSSMGRISQQVTDTSGTRPYMAPEQWLGKKQDAATDQYALAVLACELLTGEVPFASVFETGDPVVMMNVVGREPPELSKGMPHAVRKALEVALAKDPARRFATCAAFVAALGGARISSAGRARSPSAPRWIAVAAVALLALAGGAGGYLFWRRHEAEIARQAEAARRVELARQAELARQEENRRRSAEEERLRAEAERAAEGVVFELSSKAESARSLIAAETDEFKAVFAAEIRAFENDLRAGDDAKKSARYSVATNLLLRALAKATALGEAKSLRQRSQEALAAMERSRVAALAIGADKFDSASYESAQTEATAARKSSDERRFLDAIAAAGGVEKRFADLRVAAIAGALAEARADRDAGRLDHCLAVVRRVLNAEPNDPSALALKRAVEQALVETRTLASDAELKKALADLLAKPNRTYCGWDRSFQRIRAFDCVNFDKYYERRSDSDDSHGLLVDAITIGADVPVVRYLVEQKRLSVREAVDWEKQTPLHVAVKLDATNVVRYLLKKGADVLVPDGLKRIPFEYVNSIPVADMLVESGSPVRTSVFCKLTSFFDGCQYLKQHGVDVKEAAFCRRAAAEGRLDFLKAREQTCRGIPDLLYDASAGGDLPTIKWLETLGLSLAATNSLGGTVLHAASYSERTTVPIMRYLLEKSKVDVSAKNREGFTPLHGVKRPEIAECLLRAGASRTERTKRGLTPLHSAVRDGLELVMKVLLAAGADVNARDNIGWTPLYFAVTYADCATAELLLNSGADPNVVTGKNHGWRTPLLNAVNSGDEQMTRLLLRHGANVNLAIEDDNFRTALNYACFNNDLPMVKILVEAGADVNFSFHSYSGDCSPLSAAVSGLSDSGSIDVIRYLVGKGAKVNAGLGKYEKNPELKKFLSTIRPSKQDATQKALSLFRAKKYKEGFPVAQDADKGNRDIQFNLGWCYDNGFGVTKDPAEAARWYRKSAEQGNVDAQFNLGWDYENGEGVAKDDCEAAKWYRKAAEQDFANAQSALGVFYEFGRGVGKDMSEAVRLYRKAAEKGYANAQCNLGYCYDVGNGVEKDPREAARLYRLAADGGHARAQNNLAILYRDGTGVRKDDAEAARWFRKAADQGHASAQFSLGVMYDNGTGVEKDVVEAARWYRKSAEQGVVDAQFNLGWDYAHGEGVAKDDYEAVQWFRKAARQGSEKAKKELRKRNTDW